MDAILDFLVNNYLWFLIISLVLIFALIGYIVDNHEKKVPKLHFDDNEDISKLSISSQDMSLKEMIEENEKELEEKEEVIEAATILDNPINVNDLNEKNE